MIIRELYMKGFGKFRDKKLVLEEGLNIIYGVNEGGKSTLHRFIEGMFFGFVRPGVKGRRLLEDHGRYRPWIGEFYEGYMIYETRGRRYRVERNFARGREEVRVFDDISGEDLTGCFSYDKNTREYLFCEEHLGLNQTVYRNTISISQQGCANSDKEMVREIGTRLSNLSSSGDVEISIAAAEKLLKEVLDAVGTEKARTREYGKLVRQRDRLKEELDTCRDRLGHLRMLYRQLREMEKQMASLVAEKEAVEQRIKDAEGQLYLKLWKELQDLRGKETGLSVKLESLRDYRDFPGQYYEDIVALQETIESKKEEIACMEKRIGETACDMEELAGGRGNGRSAGVYYEKGIEAGGLFSQYGTLKEREEELTRELEGLVEQLEGIKSCRFPDQEDLARAEELDRRIARLEREKQDPVYLKLMAEKASMEQELKSYAWRFLLPVVIAMASVPLGLYVHKLLYGVGVVAAAAFAYILRGLWRIRERINKQVRALKGMERDNRRRDEELRQCREEMERTLSLWGVDSLLGMRLKAGEYRMLQEKVHWLEDRIEDRNRELDRICRDMMQSRIKLAGLMEEHGISVEGDIDPALFRELNDRFSRGQKTSEMLIGLRSRLEDMEDSLGRARRVLQEKEERLAEVLLKAGASSVEDYRAKLAKHNLYKNVLRELEEVRNLLELRLDGRDFDAVQTMAGELGTGVPVKEVKKEELASLKSRLEDIRERQGEITAAAEKVRGSIEALEKDFVSPADLEEDLEKTERRLRVLEREREAAVTALDIIKEASGEVHNEFAPLLNQKVSEMVERITGGRYSKLKITRDLDIYAESPETGRYVKADLLSGGTLDQFYFACRMAIADIVSGRGDLPVILDDSFVQYDIERLENIMAFLFEASRARQVLIFTCHHRDRAVAVKLGGRFHYLEL